MKTVIDKLTNNSELKSGIHVQEYGCPIEMYVQGYVPISSDWIFMNHDCMECKNMVQITDISQKNTTLHYVPIAKRVSIPNEQIIEVKPFLSILELKNKTKSDYEKILSFWRAKSYVKNVLISEPFSKGENGQIYYHIAENELLFYDRKDSIVAIAKEYMCLCSYISPVTGKIEYTMKHPDSIIPVI